MVFILFFLSFFLLPFFCTTAEELEEDGGGGGGGGVCAEGHSGLPAERGTHGRAFTQKIAGELRR